MKRDRITEIGIDDGGRLWVRPATVQFPHIYREAMEVDWDAQESRLTTPHRPEWPRVRWFIQILAAAREESHDLFIDEDTKWQDVDADLRGLLSSPQNWSDAEEIVRLRATEAQRGARENLARFLAME